jgi:hypothetical protein
VEITINEQGFLNETTLRKVPIYTFKITTKLIKIDHKTVSKRRIDTKI